jgi:hypothetical protein
VRQISLLFNLLDSAVAEVVARREAPIKRGAPSVQVSMLTTTGRIHPSNESYASDDPQLRNPAWLNSCFLLRFLFNSLREFD